VTPGPAAPPAAVDTSFGQPASAGRIARARLKGERWFVLLFDGYFNPSALSISNARRAAKKWLTENLREGDRVAIYELLPHLSLVQSFTRRLDLLEEAIDSVRIMPGSSMGQEMIRQRLEQTERWRKDFRENQLRNAGNFGSQLDRSERDNFYVSVSNLGQAMGPLEGTKAVMMFSGGFPLTRSWDTLASGGFTPRFKRMLRILEAYGIRFFTFDVGEDNTFTGADQAINLSTMVESLGLGSQWLDGLQIGAQINSATSHEEILAVLGNETGGRFMRGRNYRKGLDQVSEDLSHYYLVGYRPVDLNRVGRYVRLKVEVDGKGLKAISRGGRFNEELAREETPAPREQAKDLAGPPLRLDCRPQIFPLPGDKTLVVLPIRLSGLDEVPAPAGDEVQRLDLTLQTKALISGVVIEQSERSLAIPLTEEVRGRLAEGLMLREALLLSAAGYEIDLNLHAPGLRRLGHWKKTVPVPATDLFHFALTDLSLMSPATRAPLIFDVFLQQQPIAGNATSTSLPDPLGDARGRPPVWAGGTVSASQPLLVQVGVVKPPPQLEEGASPLEMEWELTPTAGGVPISLPVSYRRLEFAPDGSWLDVVAQLDLSEAPAGKYTLKMKATRLATSTELSREVPIELVR